MMENEKGESVVASIANLAEERGTRTFNVNNRTLITKSGIMTKILGGQTQVDQFPLNKINTAKYNMYNFLPKNLFVQIVMKLPNLYFTMLAVLQILPVIGPGIPSLLLPLSFVVTLSMIKDGFEDYQRYKSDNDENNRVSECIPIGK